MYRHLLAAAPADTGRDDPDVLLRQAGDDREQCAVGMRRLRGHVQGGVAGGGVDVGDDATGLQRRWVTARVEALQRDDSVGLSKRLVGGGFVAGLPVVDA